MKLTNAKLYRLARWLLLTMGILAVCAVLMQCSFSRYAQKAYEAAEREKPYDVVIVPGVPYEKEETGRVMKMRIYWAKYLYDHGFTNNIIFSGSAVYSPFIEGVAMKAIADSLGVPPEHTFSETTAEHSTENVYYSWKMARALGFHKIALATDPFQSRMLHGFIRRFCPGVKPLPVVMDKLDMSKPMPSIDTTAAYVPDFVSIKERENFWQRFRGTMGKRVKEDVKRSRQ